MLILYSIALLSLAIVFLFSRFHSTPSTALGASLLASFVFPSFWIIEIFGQPISIQTAAAIVSLVLFLATGGVLRWRLTAGDLAIAFVFLVHGMSDGIIHKNGFPSFVIAYGEWVLPYAAGRFAFGSVQSFSSIRWIIAIFLLVAIAVWQVDIWYRFNFLHWFSETYGAWEPTRSAERFSVRRSSGMAEHPIFFSGLLMSLLPVAVLAYRRNEDEDLTFRFLIYTFGLSVVCLTLSRAAFVALVITGLLTLVMHHRLARWPIIAIVLGLAIITFARRDLMELAWMKTGGLSDMRKHSVTINGEERLHSSTLARLLVFDVYGQAALRAGLFGYGTTAVSEFPPNIPFLPKEAAATAKVWTVENAYLLVVLRFGWLGLLAFVALVFMPITQLIFISCPVRRRELSVVAMGLTSIGFLFATVHSSYAIVFPYLWAMGIFNALVDPKIGSNSTSDGPLQA